MYVCVCLCVCVQASVHIARGDWVAFAADLAAMGVVEEGKVPALGDALEAELGGAGRVVDQQRLNAAMVGLGARFQFQTPPFYAALVRALAPLEAYGLQVSSIFPFSLSSPQPLSRLESSSAHPM